MKTKSPLRRNIRPSYVIVLLALILTIFGHGINLGIDFAGGMSMQFDMGESVEQSKVESVLQELNVDYSVSVQGADHNQVNIRIKDLSAEQVETVQQQFVEKISAVYPKVASSGEISYVGPVAGSNLVKNAILSVVIAAALMLIYIAIRFDLASGMAAVLGLLHDVVIMLSFMVILSSIVQVNSTFIAAMLTIVGYSINNTIIIFDRIRENNRRGSGDRVAVVKQSVRESLGRTLTTTATTLITIVLLYVLGVTSIKEFALPIIIGILSGAYSSNMINGYVWAALEGKIAARKTAQKPKKAKA